MRDLRRRYGSWQTIRERFACWEGHGAWAKLLDHFQVRDDAVSRVRWTVSVDSAVNRAYQHAAGACKKGPQTGTKGKIRTAQIHVALPAR